MPAPFSEPIAKPQHTNEPTREWFGLTNEDPDPNRPYQGWKNYQTWNIVLWILNTETHYRYLQHFASHLANKRWTPTQAEAFAAVVYPTGTPDLRRNWPSNRAAICWAEVAAAFNEQ